MAENYGQGSEAKYFVWNNGLLQEVATPLEGNYAIEYRYDISDLQTRIENESANNYGDIKGSFIDISMPDVLSGGAINNSGTIENIKADFVNNCISTEPLTLTNLRGAAIKNTGVIGDIEAVFINNRTVNNNFNGNNWLQGGAIYNSGTISNITADFIGNSLVGYNSDGASIFNVDGGSIGDITGNFIGNSTISEGYENGITGKFGHGQGSGIYNWYGSKIGNIKGNFIQNYAIGNNIHGVSIINLNGDSDVSEIGNITANFIDNFGVAYNKAQGAAIYNGANMGDVTGNFIRNNTQSDFETVGGAIYNVGTLGSLDEDNNLIGGIINSNFIENYVKTSEAGIAQGGAIYTNKNLNIIADNNVSTFKDNYIQVGEGEKINEAIYVDSAELNLVTNNNGAIYMYDKINGSNGYMVNITGDNSGKVALYNDIQNANVTVSNTTIDTINNKIHTYNFNNFTVTGNARMTVDVDLANKDMDKITSNSYGNHAGNLSVTGINLLSDASSNHTAILFAESGLKDNITSEIGKSNQNYQTTAYTPIFKYDVSYDNREDGGYFIFDRAGVTSSAAYNPAVQTSSVTAQVGSQSAVNETVRFAFQHMDLFSQMPSSQRMALINRNKYAIQDVHPKYNSDLEVLDKGYWVKPFTSFESINLHNGPSVDAIIYGTLVGFDGEFKELKHDWYNVSSVYAGYIGSQMNYAGVDSSLNGGMLGLTETFYKGNFFGALTATAGASLADSSTMYGNEDFTSLLGGIGAKTGYNIEFKDGKYILQPIMFMNYSFVNTFDYTNAAKVKIKSDPLHTLQINPQLKFVANIDKGWQPYASVGFVWNVLNSSKVRANDVILPKMSVNPYVEYGLGIQRNWKDKFTGFAQAMVRNGGRNGVALTFGFRWALGKDSEDL